MNENDKRWVAFGRTAPNYVWGFFWFVAGGWAGQLFPNVIGWALAADTLPSVSPPTDWTGVAIAVGLAVLVVGIAAYIVHIKRTPGQQLGEEQIERVLDAWHRKQNPTPAIVATELTYDGLTFADEHDLAKYKEAKAIIDSFKPGATQ